MEKQQLVYLTNPEIPLLSISQKVMALNNPKLLKLTEPLTLSPPPPPLPPITMPCSSLELKKLSMELI
jgi:hypothetical protein